MSTSGWPSRRARRSQSAMSTADNAMKPIPGRPIFRSKCPNSCQARATSRSASMPRTAGASLSSIRRTAASCVYVYPRPTASPANTRTTTIVVESHSSVPSDSGASVGIVRANASTLSTGQELEDLLLEGLSNDTACLGVALAQRLHQGARLVGTDVRRQRWNVRIAYRVDHERPICLECLPPCVTDVLRLLDAHAP